MRSRISCCLFSLRTSFSCQVSKSLFDAEVFCNPLSCLNPFFKLVVIEKYLAHSGYYTYMRLIHCTQKLLKELGNPPLAEASLPNANEGLGNWYANIIRIDRKKCLLFVNEGTLYSFLIPCVLKAKLKNIRNEFLNNLVINLQYEGFSLEVINRVCQEYQEIMFAKTASKHVLGAMTQLSFEYGVLIEMKEGLQNVKVPELNHTINRTILKGIKYLHPIEALREACR